MARMRMCGLRAQGRPRRGATEVGRDKIIGKLQGVVRSGVQIDLSRKTLSEHAGVTPALISYYFPKKEILLEEIASPVMRTYRESLESILNSAMPKDIKLQRTIAILVSLYTKDGRILEIYTEAMRNIGATASCELTRMTNLLVEFFSSWHGTVPGNRFDATVLQGAVWGMCRFAARVEADRTGLTDDLSPLISKVVSIVSISLSDGLKFEGTNVA